MQTFSPYTVQHLQLTEIDNISIPDQNQFFIFWCGAIPLGHLWFTKSGKITTTQDFRLNINQSIEAAISFYSEKYSHSEHPNLLQFLNNYQYRELNKQLNILSSELKDRNVPLSKYRVSVIVCTRNRPLILKRCLESLMAADDGDIEIIVVDNAPDDQSTREVTGSFQKVKYILEERKGLDIARNTGARHASNEIIAYIDDDVIISSNWIDTLSSCFNNPLTMAVTGMVFPVELQTEAQVIFEREWGFNKGYIPHEFDHRYFLERIDTGVPTWNIGAGANMAFRKEAFLLAGGFDERLDAGASGCSGDSEMWYRILAECWNCHYIPSLYVYHQHRSSQQELKQQLFSYMRGHVSALLVQYENYQHKGNLIRLYKELPKHYYYKIKRYVLNADTRKNANIFTEIKGCISGWLFYQSNKNKRTDQSFPIPDELKKDAHTDSETLVTVVIPCYNHGKYLRESVESVLQQTHKKVEVVVVNDGSEDDTALICSSYGERIKYIRTERVGLAAARNIGIHISSGKYLVFLDADDFLYPDAIETNLSFFNNNKSAVFVSGGFTLTDENRNPLPTIKPESILSDNYLHLIQGNYIAMEATVMYRRELFFHFHFDAQLKACEDYDLNLKICRHFPVISHEKIIAAYRQHGTNMSADRSLMLTTVLEVMQRQEKMLYNDKERKAYKAGLKNWKEYYK